jgi:hypothetical protein
MRDCLFRKGLVVGIMILFFGVSIISSVSGDIKNIGNIEKVNYFRGKGLRSSLIERMDTYGNNNLRLNQIVNILPIFDGSFRGWSTTEIVSTESTETSNLPSIAVDSNGDVHVIWTDKTNYAGSGSDWDIFYKMKPNGGSWTTTEVVSSESNAYSCSYTKSLNIDSNGDIHVVWEEEEYDTNYYYYVFYKMKPNGGSWTTAEMISSEIDNYPNPSSVVDSDGTIHVVWSERSGGVGDIFYRYKPSGGSWSDAEKVPLEEFIYPWTVTLVVDSDGTVHLAWNDNSNYGGSGSDWDIFYKNKPSGGSWSAMEVVSTESSDCSDFPDLEMDSNGDLHIIFFDLNHMSQDTYIKYKSKPSGGSWTSAEIVSLYGNAFVSDLAVESDGTVHVTWEEENIEDPNIMWDVFYRKKPSGSSWNDAELVSTEGGEYTFSINPNIAVDLDGIVHVGWADDYDFAGSGEDGDIFYKNKTGGNQAPNKPTITGETEGKVGVEYEYTFNAVDPDGDDVKYFVDWDDGEPEETGFNPSGDDVKLKNTWNSKGTYTITAYAEDTNGLVGPEGTLTVIIKKGKNRVITSPFQWFLQPHPNLFPILRHLLRL